MKKLLIIILSVIIFSLNSCQTSGIKTQKDDFTGDSRTFCELGFPMGPLGLDLGKLQLILVRRIDNTSQEYYYSYVYYYNESWAFIDKLSIKYGSAPPLEFKNTKYDRDTVSWAPGQINETVFFDLTKEDMVKLSSDEIVQLRISGKKRNFTVELSNKQKEKIKEFLNY